MCRRSRYSPRFPENVPEEHWVCGPEAQVEWSCRTDNLITAIYVLHPRETPRLQIHRQITAIHDASDKDERQRRPANHSCGLHSAAYPRIPALGADLPRM